MDFIELVKQSAEKKIIYTLHALDEMNAENEMITTDEVRYVVFNGETIEDYSEDKRGHSCLMLGMPNNRRPVHPKNRDRKLNFLTNPLPLWEGTKGRGVALMVIVHPHPFPLPSRERGLLGHFYVYFSGSCCMCT
jgi:hypothetical protein